MRLRRTARRAWSSTRAVTLCVPRLRRRARTRPARRRRVVAHPDRPAQGGVHGAHLLAAPRRRAPRRPARCSARVPVRAPPLGFRRARRLTLPPRPARRSGPGGAARGRDEPELQERQSGPVVSRSRLRRWPLDGRAARPHAPASGPRGDRARADQAGPACHHGGCARRARRGAARWCALMRRRVARRGASLRVREPVWARVRGLAPGPRRGVARRAGAPRGGGAALRGGAHRGAALTTRQRRGPRTPLVVR